MGAAGWGRTALEARGERLVVNVYLLEYAYGLTAKGHRPMTRHRPTARHRPITMPTACQSLVSSRRCQQRRHRPLPPFAPLSRAPLVPPTPLLVQMLAVAAPLAPAVVEQAVVMINNYAIFRQNFNNQQVKITAQD